MESQQVVDYISEQLNAGHSEAELRQHLLAHDWSAAAVDSAFERYHQATMPKPAELKTAKKRYRVRIPRWTRARVIKLGTVFAVVVVLAVGVHIYQAQRPVKQAAAVPITYVQRQTQDVVIVGGAVANFVADSGGKLPVKDVVAADGNLLLCAAVCDPATPEVSRLQVYRPADVSIMAYSSGLEVPDKGTMYIVPGGSCHGNAELGEQSARANSAVILYGRWENNALSQRCVQL